MASQSPRATSIGPKYPETLTWAIRGSEWHDLLPYDFTVSWWDERAMPAKFSSEPCFAETKPVQASAMLARDKEMVCLIWALEGYSA